MARTARIVIPGIPHHITQRGNNKQQVFWDDEDRQTYLDILVKQSSKYHFDLQGYCLMSNHVHIIGVPREPDSLSKAVGRTNYTYTQYINKRYERSGHLWQNRFFSCPMDTSHTFSALQYVEQNPVRAGLEVHALNYQWSSAREHCGLIEDKRILKTSLVEARFSPQEWRELLSIPVSELIANEIRDSLKTGQPLGDEAFTSSVEAKLGKPIRPNPVGRPKHPKP